ncbi:hypothetical protein GF354_04620 [Candidatus Peregrinibacteria bacterium]|nr:hypothetical protein [Candidatus Peregrinibacteria bacterium]
MKKKLFSLLMVLTVSATVFAGCNWFQESEDMEPAEGENEANLEATVQVMPAPTASLTATVQVAAAE